MIDVHGTHHCKSQVIRATYWIQQAVQVVHQANHCDDCCHVHAQYQVPHTLYSLSSCQDIDIDMQHSLLHVGIHLSDNVALCFVGGTQDRHLSLMCKDFFGYSVCMQPRQAAHQLTEAFFQAQPENSVPPCLLPESNLFVT